MSRTNAVFPSEERAQPTVFIIRAFERELKAEPDALPILRGDSAADYYLVMYTLWVE
jgi:hypothetical protein